MKARPLNEELRQLNSYLEETRGKLARHYRELLMQEKEVTAESVKNAFIGKTEEQKNYTMLWLVKEHNTVMNAVLKRGSMKNYLTTEKYLKSFLKKKFHKADIHLKDLTYEFITAFEFYVRSNPRKQNDPCTNNGTMKHMERLKKMVTWAVKNEWMEKNPFINYQLKFKRYEREFLQLNELTSIETQIFDNEMLQKVKGLVPGIYESSDNKVCLGLSKRSNRYIRSLLVEATWVAVRTDMALQTYYRKHAAKEPNKAIIKVAHKLLSRMRAVIISGVPYQTGLVK